MVSPLAEPSQKPADMGLRVSLKGPCTLSGRRAEHRGSRDWIWGHTCKQHSTLTYIIDLMFLMNQFCLLLPLMCNLTYHCALAFLV